MQGALSARVTRRTRYPVATLRLRLEVALDHADLVDDLLATELREGWIRPVPGGDEELRRRYRHTAVGKLGVVVSPDRPPRLVVDGSVSGVTSNTHLPNKAPNPSLADVRKCLPLCPANESLAALVLDVSKAHRRVRIKPEDQGLLCFRHRDVLYQSVTLNFGARASGFYWNRVAGLLVRLTHRLWRVRHSAQIYVDDLSALLVVLLCVLRVPMSWRKAALPARVTWIGWSFDFDAFTVELDPSKLRRLMDLLQLLSASPRCTVSALEKLTGKLLWLSNLFQTFRPSLAPLYIDQHRPLPNMCATSADLYASLRSSLSDDLFPWAASCFALHTPQSLPSRTSQSMSHLAEFGSRLPTPSARRGSFHPTPMRSCSCG